MPLKWFNCPAGKIEVADCLEKCPRPEGRCLSLPTLHEIGSSRPWTGTPSTTMLLNGTRLEYLKITTDYAVKPDDRAFALLGTRHHGRLEVIAKQLEMVAEEKLKGEVSGIVDLLEPDDTNPGQYRLIDYKTWGSYPVSKALGLKGKPDFGGSDKQVNNYRIMAEAIGFKVSDMFIQATVRDGGTRTAKSYGVDKKFYFLKVPRLDDDLVQAYFSRKGIALLTALNTKTCPGLCSFEERWQGRKCAKYCDVYETCRPGRSAPKRNEYGSAGGYG